MMTRQKLAGARAHATDFRANWRRTATACAALLAFSAVEARAQSAGTTSPAASDDTGAGAVVVTGIRRSLQDSLQVKRGSDEIVEVISAEDIGKLPDESIADSLTRLPGLAGQRVQGRYQDISIRGLSPDFTSTLLDGFQQASTGDNRAAEFDQYPSELISGVTVYKSPDPNNIGQGLAGTVNLQTLNPLDRTKRVIAINVRGSQESGSKLNPGTSLAGSRISAAYVDQFRDGTVGFALGYAHLDAPEQEKHYHAWWWQPQDGLLPAADKGAQVLNGAEVYAYSRTLVRDAVMSTLEFKPNANFHSTNTLYYSKFKETELMHGAEWMDFAESTGPILNPTVATIGGQLINTSGTAQGVVPILISNWNTRKDTLLSFISRNTWDVNGWKLSGDLSYSYAERKETNMEQYAHYGATRTLDNLTYSGVASGQLPSFTPGLNYADASKVYLGDPAPWGGWGHDGTVHDPTTKDTFTEGKFMAKHDVEGGLSAIFKDFDVGFDYSDRVKQKTESDFNLFLNGSGGPSSYSSAFSALIPAAAIKGTSNLSFGGFPGMVGYDPQAVMSLYTLSPINDTNQYDRDWRVEELLGTAFFKATIRSEVHGMPVTGNLGAQYVYSTQKSRGFITQNTSGGTLGFVPYSKSVSYGEFLPSLNLRLELPFEQDIRFAAAREMSRPRLDDLRANASAGVSSPGPLGYGSWSGNGGNPNLRPWLANAIDLTYDKYFSKASYISFAYFYKDVQTYIYTQDNPHYDFTGYPNISGYPVNPATGNFGDYQRPNNGQGGKVEGIELGGNFEGRLISPWLNGFGVDAGASRTWTTIMSAGPTSPGVPLPGLSGTVASWTAYYEKDGFSARIGQRYRSAYRGQVAALFALLSYTEIAASRTTDAQLSYEFKTGRLAGLTLLLQGYNLTNSPYKEYMGNTPNPNPTQLGKYETYGRTLLFGFNYKM
jgi:iron complex outermembrane receptor protein